MRLIDADAFKEYIRNSYEEVKHMYRDGGKLAKHFTEAFCKDIDEQPTIDQQKWIPVSERFPDKKQDVLVTINYFELDVVTDIWDGDLFRYYGENVVAWMPFPEPYKGDVTDSQDESTPVYFSDLYLCDPDKNTECKKTSCYRNGGECIHTVHKEYRRVE